MPSLLGVASRTSRKALDMITSISTTQLQPSSAAFDVVVVGGGLSGGLITWRLAQRTPTLRVAVVESQPTLGGNHTWCFFDTDLSEELRVTIAPLVAYHWDRYSVRFPSYERKVETPYSAVTSERFNDVLRTDLAPGSIFQSHASEIGPRAVTLANGTALRTNCVIDARGARDVPHLVLGFQKFVALEVELTEPHNLPHPIIMDATIPQADGYRFFYTLPLTETRLLIYDTYYSDGRDLARETLERRIRSYIDDNGWRLERICREEHGVLPIVLAGDAQQLQNNAEFPVPSVGLAAGLFHPTTGYSLPDAVRTADLLARAASAGTLTTESARRVVADTVRTTWQDRGFYRLLNRMLFRAAAPEARYQVLERFYGFDAGLIQRFYAAQLTRMDQLRIVVGKPPVPLGRAIRVVSERNLLTQKGNGTS